MGGRTLVVRLSVVSTLVVWTKTFLPFWISAVRVIVSPFGVSAVQSKVVPTSFEVGSSQVAERSPMPSSVCSWPWITFVAASL